jgi:hypothetical protein
MYGEASGLWGAIGGTSSAVSSGGFDRNLESARAALDSAGFAQAWANGQSRALEVYRAGG